jgi:hypothetical protein
MGHGLVRNWQLRAVILSVITLCFAVLAATASAITVNSNTGASVCTLPSEPAGSCTFSGNGSANISGRFITPYQTADPIGCGNQVVDGDDTFCGHLGLNFNTVSGAVTVTITGWDPNYADLDLCIVDSAGQVVGCATGSGGTETITFTVSCTDTHFEAQVLPVMYFDFIHPPTLMNPLNYTGGVSTSLTSCVSGTGNGNGGGGNSATGHKVTGGGQLGFASIANANFSVNVMATTSGFKGKVQIADNTGCTFRGLEITAVSWNDGAHDAKIFGNGYAKSAPNTKVPFVAEAQDNGDGSSNNGDFLTIDKCNGGGQVVNGNIQYHT